MENIRDPRTPKSGCYDDVRWSEKDGRYWSSLACFESPDIEGGVKTEPVRSRNSGLPRPAPRTSEDKTAFTLDILELPRSLDSEQRKFEFEDDFIEKEVKQRPKASTPPPLPILNIPSGDQDDFTNILNSIFSARN